MTMYFWYFLIQFCDKPFTEFSIFFTKNQKFKESDIDISIKKVENHKKKNMFWIYYIKSRKC